MPDCPECGRDGLMCGLCIRCVRRFAGPEGVFPDASIRAGVKWLGYDPGIKSDGSVDNRLLVACADLRRGLGQAAQVICCNNPEEHMRTTVTLEFESAEEAAAFLAGGTVPATPASAPRGGKAKPAAEPEPDEDDDGSEGISYDEISALVVRVSKEVGRDDAINLLKRFKNPANKKPATKGSEIAPADYPRAKEEAEALLEGADVS